MTAELFAFTLTLGAGAATGGGAALVLLARRAQPAFLAVALGFSAGVMLYVSFVEILPQATESLSAGRGETTAPWLATGGFFGGIIIAAIIDRFMPEATHSHGLHLTPAQKTWGSGADGAGSGSAGAGAVAGAGALTGHESQSLKRLGAFTALALALHNFPEGFATFLTGLTDTSLALPVALAIAIHNIPEGVAVAIPIFYATGNRTRAFWLAFASGLAEPAGAIIGWLLLAPFLTDTVFGAVFAAVAGIMVYISLDELLPSAQQFGSHRQVIYGLIVGMAVMALSLLTLG